MKGHHGKAYTIVKNYKNVGSSTCPKIELPYKWPVERGVYKTGNPYHPTAVFLPSPNPTLEKAALESGVAIVGICYTANIGLEKVICNIVSNPNIRYLIVVGHDNEGHRSGDAMVKLWRYGIDPKTRRIINALGQTPYINNLPLEVIERFRKQVKLIDMLELEDPTVLKRVIHGTIQEPHNKVKVEIKGVTYELYDPCAYLEEPPIKIALSDLVVYGEAIAEYFTTGFSFVHSRTIGEAWPKILSTIGSFGIEYEDERGLIVKEILNMVVHIEEPLSEPMIPEGYPKSRSELEEYFDSLYLAHETHGFEYTYGERILSYNVGGNVINQLETIIEKLKNSRQTRRAMMVLWNPLKDLFEEEVPCITVVQVLIRNNTLHLTSYIRSNDMYLAWPANAYALAKLGGYIAKRVGVKMGTLTTHSVSAHVYL